MSRAPPRPCLYASRTLVTQVDIPNPTGELQAGLYITVTLAIPRVSAAVSVPNDALIFDQNGTHVAVVEAAGDGRFVVRMRPVRIYRQNAADLELRDGLDGGERVVVGPPAGLREGEAVSVRTDGKARS